MERFQKEILMTTFSLDRFRSQVLSEGLARTNRFQVFIIPPLAMNSYKDKATLVSLYCEETNFPPLSTTVKSYKLFGPAHQRAVSSEFGGEGISMTFHIDSSMYVKRFFEEWMYATVDPETFLLNYHKDYASNIQIDQLDEEDNIVYQCEIIDAFPRSINLLQLNNSAQNQTHRLTVMFAYRRWYGFTDRELGIQQVVPERTNIDNIPRQ